VVVIFFRNDGGLFEAEFFVDDWTFNEGIGEHIGEIDVVEFGVLVFEVGM
jgi:hypothetical protein